MDEINDVIEGHVMCCIPKANDLKKLSCFANNILEIGFNAGHSSNLFLSNNKRCLVTSFDLGAHSYVNKCKENIDKLYPNRHTLILGDSTETVPKHDETKKFDFMFIDGGHDYEVALKDIRNCKRLSHQSTIACLDDTMFTNDWVHEYTKGPTKAFLELIKEGEIEKMDHCDYSNGYGMAWFMYN